MNEESVANQYSPIDPIDHQLDGSDNKQNFEMMNASLNEEQPAIDLSKTNLNDVEDERIADNESRTAAAAVNEATNLSEEISHQGDDDDRSNRQTPSFDEHNTKLDVDKTNLNDDISEDDELDFEEGDNSRGGLNDEQQQLQQQQRKRPAEDGEVNSEEELEDGEVKEEDSDEDNEDPFDINDVNNPNLQSPANLNALCRFYSKGLCTWGSSCRFVHQKPIGKA